MKKLAVVTALACTALIAAAPAAPPNPVGLDPARKAFVAAIKAKDWKALGELVSWPVAIDGYEAAPTIAKAAYLKDHKKLTDFLGDDETTLKCIAGDPATYEGDKSQFGFGSWVIDCNGNEYYFGEKGGKVLFTAYGNINE